MKVRVCRPEELGAAETAQWRAFNRAQPSLASPFLWPDFALAVGRRRPDARVAVLEESSGGIVGFFPFQRGLAGVGKAIGHGLSDYQGVVAAPGVTWHGPELLRACGLTAWEFTHLVADQAPLFAPQILEEHPSPVIDLTDGGAAWVARQTSNRFKKTRRDERKLGREEGEVVVELDARHRPELLDTLMAWKSAQYVRTGRQDRFRDARFVETLRELLTVEGNGFTAPLSVMSVGERVVALLLVLRADGVVAHWFPTYDTELARYSPGMVHLVRTVQLAADDGVHTFDLGVGESSYKDAFADTQHAVGAGAVRRRTAGAAASWLRTEPARAATNFVLARPGLRRAARRTLTEVGRLRSAAARP